MRLSTAAQQEHGTLYEFRTYNIRPEQNAAFLKLTNEKIHLRTAHSQLIGYWSVEYGGLNQVFHIWKYGEKVLQLRRSSSISVWTQEVTPFFLPCPLPPAPPLSSDSYAQRAGVRAALAQDPSWISEYISKALPMLRSQDNQVVYLVPWSHLQEPPKEGGKPRSSQG